MSWSVGITNPLLVFRFIEMARERADVEVYAPKYTKKQYIRKMDKYKDVDRPAYGGYIFVNILDEHTIFNLMRITIACTILRANGQFVYLRESEIDRLKEMEASNLLIPSDDNEVKVKFEDGKIVTVKHGAFTGKQAKMTEIDKHNNKLIWADIAGKKIKIPLYFFEEMEDGCSV